MSKPDLSKLSFSELQELAAEARGLAEAKRGEELKVLVDGWAKKAQANQFSISEVIEEFKKYLPKESAGKTRAPRGSVARVPKPYLKGAVYKNPNGPETWTGGSIGRQPPWLTALIPAELPLEEKTKKFAALAKK